MSKRKVKVSQRHSEHKDKDKDKDDNDNDIDNKDDDIDIDDLQLQQDQQHQEDHLEQHNGDDDIQDLPINNNDLELNDDFNFFSLDMVTDDMDFEQAYSTYNLLQQKNAISAVEHLKKVQILNQQYDSSFGNYDGYSQQSNFHQQIQPPLRHQAHAQGHEQAQAHAQGHEQAQAQAQAQAHSQAPSQANSLPHTHFPAPHHLHLQQQAQQIKGLMSLDYHSTIGSKGEMDDFDHFFSNTESDALEKFLDNLANPSNSPAQTDFYTHQPQRLPQQAHSQSPYFSEGEKPFSFPSYELQTMKPIVNNQTIQQAQHQVPSLVKEEELSDAFSHPPSKNDASPQLPTPTGMSPGKRSFLNDLESSEFSFSPNSSASKKRKRSTTKQLLTLEQKKLNHSYSEQKRRQLCKLAYERCLRLIVNLDEFLNLHKDGKKDGKASLKKKQKLRDGLPNISKYTALVRISNEIITIQDKNRELQKLLAA